MSGKRRTPRGPAPFAATTPSTPPPPSSHTVPEVTPSMLKSSPGVRTFAPLGRVAWAACVLVAAVLVGLAVSGRLDDPDVWQHLLVGRVLWATHALPRTDVWTWPGYGGPYVVVSWLFRVLLWPFWALGHEWGLATWRWLTALGAFALLWRAARRAGATGLAPLLVIVWAALLYRQRSQIRPDTLAAVLLGVEIWMLEARRQGARVRVAWLVPLACVWINAHISFYQCFLVGGAYLLDESWRAWRGRAGAHPWPLALALGLALLACFVNPYGLELLRQPFTFFFELRHEPMYQIVSELRPVAWDYNRRNGLALFMLAWPVLAALRWRRRGPDLAELVLLPLASAQVLMSQRFIGTFALLATPFMARDLADALRTVRWPAWMTRPIVRPALCCAACVLLAAPELARPEWPLGVAPKPNAYPVAACDWIAAHGVRGRSFSAFSDGGYLLWRFWPERDRLPFSDIHLSGTRADRDLYAYAWSDSGAWHELQAERNFDWVLLRRRQGALHHLLDYLDADSTYALVFADDVAALYLRRHGALADVARRHEYGWVPAGERLLPFMVQGVQRDAGTRRLVREELLRQIADSPRTAQARSQLASLEGLDGHPARMLQLLQEAAAIDPRSPRIAERIRVVRERLGLPPEHARR